MKTAIVIPSGFDGMGTSTLGYEYAKIGLDVYFRDLVQVNQERPSGDFNVYSNTDELINILVDYEQAIFTPFLQKSEEKEIQEVYCRLRTVLPELKVGFIYCSRRDIDLPITIKLCDKYDFKFDYIYSLQPVLGKSFNLNAYTFHDLIEVVNREPVILTAGRIEGFKGTTRYCNTFNEVFMKDDFYYVHEGGRFNWNKNGNISTNMQLLSFFDTSVSPKVLKPQYALKHYGESPEIDKLNIYPCYNRDAVIERWPKYYLSVCCILGTKSKQKLNTSLFTDEFEIVCEDKRDTTYINNTMRYWNNALEYANLEMIDAGLPLLFSKAYANILGYIDERLIYSCFEEIPQKAKELRDCYDEARLAQRQFFIDKQKMINDNIIKNFTEGIC